MDGVLPSVGCIADAGSSEMVDNFFLSLVNICGSVRITLSLFRYRQDAAPTTTNPPMRYKVYSLSALATC